MLYTVRQLAEQINRLTQAGTPGALPSEDLEELAEAFGRGLSAIHTELWRREQEAAAAVRERVA